MSRFPTLPLAVLLVAAIGGCQSIPEAPAAQDFVAAANALVQAESDYFDQIQTASDDSHVLRAAQYYVGHDVDWPVVGQKLSERDDFSKAKAVRVAMMAQLQNYAQQISAITAAATGTWVAADAKATATSVASLLKDAGAKVSAAQAGLIQAAVTDLAAAIVNAETTRKLQSLAVEARPSIAAIAAMVAQDNAIFETDDYVANLAADQRTAMLDLLNHVYADRSAGATQRFDIMMAWRDWKPSMVTKGKDISAALAKLIKANDALAAAQNVTAGALAAQAFAIAQQAVGTPAAAK